MRERTYHDGTRLFPTVLQNLKLSSLLILFSAGMWSARKRDLVGSRLLTMKLRLSTRIEAAMSKKHGAREGRFPNSAIRYQQIAKAQATWLVPPGALSTPLPRQLRP